MRSLTSSMLIWLVLVISFPTPSLTIANQENRAAAAVVNIAGFPASITDASVDSMIVSSSIEFDASNRSGETISELYFRVFIYDRKAKLVGSDEGIVIQPLSPGETRHCHSLIDPVVNEDEKVFVVVTKIKTTGGVWSINTQDVATNLKPNEKGPIELQVPLTHEFDLTLTKLDKTEILGSALEYLLNDSSSAKYLGDRTSLLLLRDNCELNSSKIGDATVRLLTSEQLQVIADKERRAVFLRCESFEVEGSRVSVLLLVNDRVARNTEQLRIPFRFNYRFICVKRDNRWVVERLYSYS